MSDSTQRASFVTIGIVALNRAWIIDQVFSSILSQTYLPYVEEVRFREMSGPLPRYVHGRGAKYRR